MLLDQLRVVWYLTINLLKVMVPLALLLAGPAVVLAPMARYRSQSWIEGQVIRRSTAATLALSLPLIMIGAIVMAVGSDGIASASASNPAIKLVADVLLVGALVALVGAAVAATLPRWSGDSRFDSRN